MALQFPLGVSNKHIHISAQDRDVLFGKDEELHIKKDLKQPGQYAAEETVTIVGPKGQIPGVRVLGPLRKQTQVELAITDARKLGVAPVVRESGATIVSDKNHDALADVIDILDRYYY